jgi:hypothetical protein
MVETLYDCAKFRYECGNYSEAAEYLYFYRILVRSWGFSACGYVPSLPSRLLLITRT